MIRIENHCCECATDGFPCIGESCPRRNVEVFYCDDCEEEIYGDVYESEGEELCEFCLLKKHKKE